MNDCTAWPHCRGFSLIELLIAMTVVSILAAIALPAYQGYLQQGRRYEAQQQLLEQALALERIYTQQGRYPDTFDPPFQHGFLPVQLQPARRWRLSAQSHSYDATTG